MTSPCNLSVKKNYNKKKAVITGASSGIGYEFAILLAKNGYDLILIGRNIDKLNQIQQEFEQTYKIQIIVYLADLSCFHEIDKTANKICEDIVNIDILINCAGFGRYGEFYQTDFDIENKMIAVNIVSLTYLTKRILQKMIQRNSGKILNVSSTAAFKAGPFMSVYSATKAYVLSFSEAVANEIKNTGVTLTILCPGVTNTEFLNKASLEMSQHFKLKKIMTPQEVALCGYKALMRGQAIAIPGLMNKFLVLVVKFLPRAFIIKIMHSIKKRK